VIGEAASVMPAGRWCESGRCRVPRRGVGSMIMKRDSTPHLKKLKCYVAEVFRAGAIGNFCALR
jgi:hypothetical protein